MHSSDDFQALTKEQQSFMISWLKENFTPISHTNNHHTAYGLKQKFSRLNFYVSSKQFATAMELAGFIVKKEAGKDESFFRFNISQKSKFFVI